jgi:hypothetical protein
MDSKHEISPMATPAAVRISNAERAMILEALYQRFMELGKLYYDPLTTRLKKRQLRTERRALAALLNKVEGTGAVSLLPPEVLL